MSNELIARLEAATGPDRELDRAIVDAVRGKPKPGFQHGRIERFTASIDAALTLAKGWPEVRIWNLWNAALCECSKAECHIVDDLPRFLVSEILRAKDTTHD